VRGNVKSTNTRLTVELRRLVLGQPGDSIKELAVGDAAVVCFTSSAQGWVTLWAIDPDGSFSLIYPNKFVTEGNDTRAMHVAAGERHCVGDDPRFQFIAAEPAGKGHVYLHWTANLESQIGAEDYPVIGGETKGISKAPEGYASAEFPFNVEKKSDRR
jgi:hypothetical protein